MTEQRYVHRVLRETAPDYERGLATALLRILGEGVHDAAGIVAALNARNVRTRDDAAWSEDTFMAEMERLGAYPNSAGAALGSHAEGTVPPGSSRTMRAKYATSRRPTDDQ